MLLWWKLPLGEFIPFFILVTLLLILAGGLWMLGDMAWRVRGVGEK